MDLEKIRYKWAVFSLTFITGACGIAYEYTFAKLASDLLGNTVHEWALTIAVMLFAMGIGADIQKRIPDSAIFTRFIAIEIVLSIVGGWGGFALLEVFALKRLHFTFVQMLLHFAIGMMIGMEIPLLIRMNARFKKTLSLNLGQIFRLDYWGGFAGALIWIYILLYWLPTTLAAAFMISICNILSVGIALLTYQKIYTQRKHLFLCLGIATLALTSFLYGLLGIDHWSLALEQRLFADTVISRTATPYQNIVLTENKHGDLRMYLNGQLQFSSQDEYIYHEMLVHPALFLAHAKDTLPPARIAPSSSQKSPKEHPTSAERSTPAEHPASPQNVLILGGGDGLAVREILKYPNIAKIVLVDIDSTLIRLAQTHPKLTLLNENSLNASKTQIIEHSLSIFSENPTLQTLSLLDRSQAPHKVVGTQEIHLYTLDAYAFLKMLSTPVFTEQGGFDVIIADFPDPNKIELSKLYSLSFYTYLKNLLTADGVFIQQASSPYYAEETFAIIGATLRSAGFSAVALHTWIPSFGDWGWYIARTSAYQTSTELYNELYRTFTPLVSTRFLDKVAMKRALLFSKESSHLDPYSYTNSSSNNLASSQAPPQKLSRPPVNTLLNHLAYKTYRTEMARFQ